MVKVDTPASFGLSLSEVENQRTTEGPWIPGFMVSHHAEAIKKIRSCELPFMGHGRIETLQHPHFFSRNLDGNETSLNT